MTTVKSNEREFMSQVTSWLNEFITHGSYPFEGASSEPSVKAGDETSFPDVQVWLNRKAGQCFCELALKTPKTTIDDSELLSKAADVARDMKANFFVTWNMRDAVIWRTPQEGKEVTRENKARTYDSIYQISCADDLWDKSKYILLRDRAREILEALAILHREGHLHQVDIDATFFVKLLKDAVDTLGPYVHDSLTAWAGRYPKFRERLFDWAVGQGIANFGDEVFYETVSRQVAYRLLVKILFYQVLKRFRDDLPKMELSGIDFSKTSEVLKEFFAKAKDIDYQAVFEEDVPDTVPLSAKAGRIIAGLLDNLNDYNFSQMPQDVIGQVFEKLIPPHERHSLGQYFTREDLVDFINAFCVRSVEDKILDPTCGSGTFLIRAYERLKHMGERDHKKLLSKLWGIDVARFPAALATMNLFRQHLHDYANFPRIDSRDFFNVRPGDTFEFPPPRATEDPGFKIKEKLPVFNGAVGNFPYIRQELIEKRILGYKKKLQEVLTEDWLKEYRELFDKKNKPHLSGQADIYAYLFFHLPRFLKEDGGRMGIVTSNAWLDVAYGYELQRFFLKNFKIVAVLESRCEPWFEDSQVNTIVIILERCKNAEERNRHLVKFVKVKKKLQDLIPYDMKLESNRRFHHLDGLVHKIEGVGKEYSKMEGTKIVNTLKGLKTYEDEDFRIRVIRQGELLEEIEKTGKTAKWGKYLRAPEVYFEIMDKCKNMLMPLEEVADVRFGIKTGINEFFHLTKDKIKHWEIEKEFLAPIVTSLREIEEPVINPKKLRFLLFNCHKSLGELRRGKKSGALAYIKFGEEQKTKGRGRVGRSGLRYPDIPSVQGRTYWYDVGDREPGDLVINRFTGKRFFFPVNKHKVMISDAFFEVKFKESNSAMLYQAILNSTLFYLFAELTGRITWTQGVLYFYGPEIKELLVPNLIDVDKGLYNKIIEAFNKILSRPLEAIFEETKKKDRRNLDSLILKAMGLAPEEYLKQIYFGLCELVKERVELVKIGQKTRLARTEREVEKIKEELIREVLPESPRKFPEEFLPTIKKEDFQEISIPASPLKLGRYFFGKQEVVSEDGDFRYQARSVEEARFIIYSQKPNTFLVEIPRDNIATSKAVAKYEKYLRELKDEFFAGFFQRVHDHKQADALTQAVFQELNLPEV